MKNITLSAPEELIEAARKRATAKGTTLNSEFRTWLGTYADRQQLAATFDELTKKIHFTSDRKYTREEMNER